MDTTDFEQKLNALKPELKGFAENLRDAANILDFLATLTEDADEPLSHETLGQCKSLLTCVRLLLSPIDELTG